MKNRAAQSLGRLSAKKRFAGMTVEEISQKQSRIGKLSAEKRKAFKLKWGWDYWRKADKEKHRQELADLIKKGLI